MRKILFVDRDGTILVEPIDQQIDSLEKFAFVDGAIEGLKRFSNAGWQLILISNQDGLGTPSFPLENFERPQELMLQILGSCGVAFQEILICPHFSDDDCACRKPKPGLLTKVIEEGFDRAMSIVIGDRKSDRDLAEILGIEGFQLGPDWAWSDICDSLITRARTAHLKRDTRETQCEVRVNLDIFRTPEIRTGQKFFDHLLEQIAYHAQIGLVINLKGDWAVDDHHSIEDTALVLGACLHKALGTKQGIARYGFVLPMDECLAQAALDLSGRPFSRLKAHFTRDVVGGLAVEMLPHFFRSLADGLKATIHITLDAPDDDANNHHRMEAAFKAFGRCLGQAIRSGQKGEAPSSKGCL